MASSTRARVPTDTGRLRDSTWDTVVLLTPACWATSAMVIRRCGANRFMSVRILTDNRAAGHAPARRGKSVCSMVGRAPQAAATRPREAGMRRARTDSIARRVRALAAAAVVALVATACVGGGGQSDDGDTQAGQTVQPITPKEPTSPVTVTFQSWVGEAQQMKKLAADFKKLHPNITIKFMNVPADSATQKLTTQVAGGNPPDTVFVDSGAVQDFAARKAFVNLDGYIAGSQAVKLDDYIAGFKQTATYQNRMFALPYDGETTGLFYRTDLFQAAGITGPPKTWDELQTAAEKLTNPSKKQYGYILFAPEA